MSTPSTDSGSSQQPNVARYKCVACPAIFSFRRHLCLHLKKLHNYKIGDVSKESKKYQVCELCEMVFSNINDHKQLVHGLKVEDSELSQQLCSTCGIFLSCQSAMKSHQETVHSTLEVADQMSIKKKYSRNHTSRIKCPKCRYDNLKTYKNLIDHLKSEHSIEIEYEQLKFNSFEEFEKWKGDYEDNHYVVYTRDSSSKSATKTGIRTLYYHCHRSYKYKANTKPKLKVQKFIGTNKIGNACPSHMKVNIINSDCLVYFWKTHVGHTAELQRCNLRKSERAEIAKKLQQNIPMQRILDDARNSLEKGAVLRRRHLLTKKDIHNISRDYKVKYNRAVDVSDIDKDITEWVKEMSQEVESPIVYFKNSGNVDETGLLIDDFVLILVLPSQIPLLEKFGNKVICIDHLERVLNYRIGLYIIMTFDDELETACAVAFCFANRSDETFLQLFFEQIKTRLGLIKTSLFISNLNAATYKAWSVVMSEVPNILWSKWHITSDWQKHAKTLISHQQKLKWTLKELKRLQETEDSDSFNHLFSDILNEFYVDLDLTRFGNHFISCYVDCTDMWTPCFRQHLTSIDTALELLHNAYVQVCTRVPSHKQFVKTAETVLKIARDNYFQQMVKVSRATQNSVELQNKENLETTTECLRQTEVTENENISSIMQSLKNILENIEDNHRKSETIPSEMIVTLQNESEWIVFSCEQPQLDYVVKQSLLCVDCEIRCRMCNICIHEFKCSCVDFENNITICSHIHACVRMFNKSHEHSVQNNNVIDSVDSDILSNCNSDIFEIMYVKENETKRTSFLEALQHKTNLLLNLSKQITLSETSQKHVLNRMNEIINIYDEVSN